MSDEKSPGADDAVAALSALYQAERSDGAALHTANLAFIAIAVAYVGLTITVVNAETAEYLGGLAVGIVPLPLWIMVVFYEILSFVQGFRSSSGQVLEEELVRRAGISDKADAVGLAATESIFDITKAKGGARLALATSYGGSVLLILGYTVYMLSRAWQVDHHVVMLRALIVLYAVIGLVILLAVRSHARARSRLFPSAIEPVADPE